MRKDTMGGREHVAHMSEMKNAYKSLVVKPGWKRPHGRPRRRWYKIQMHLDESVNWIQ
jgi:hypothetical protein